MYTCTYTCTCIHVYIVLHEYVVCIPCSDLLQPDLLEDVIVSVCLKQHGLASALQLLSQSEPSRAHSSGGGQSEPSRAHSSGGDGDGGGGGGDTGEAGREVEAHFSLLDAVFTRINGLERRLQVQYMYTSRISTGIFARVDVMGGAQISPHSHTCTCIHVYYILNGKNPGGGEVSQGGYPGVPPSASLSVTHSPLIPCSRL